MRAPTRFFLTLIICIFVTALNAAGTARISVNSFSVIEGNAGPGSATLNFTLTRSGETNSAVILQYQTDDNSATAPGDYTAIPPTRFTLPAGQLTGIIPVLVDGDAVLESNESLFLHLTGIVDVLGPPSSYAAASDFAVGTAPGSIATMDVNGDGRPDLAVANHTGTVSVLLNTTAPGADTPGYAAASDFTAGDGLRSVIATDVNGDGRPDLAVANLTGGAVSVLLNTTAPGASTASYAAVSDFAAGPGPVSVTATDVNNDGRPDLAVANFTGGTVSVLLNTTAPGASTASYTAASELPAGSGPVSVTAADINRDGRPDLAVANQGSDSVSVLLNTTASGASTASYAVASDFTVGTGPASVTAVDVNGDGRSDLAVVNSGSDNVSVLLNSTAPGAGTASYAGANNFAVGSYPQSISASDLNGDSRPDLAVVNMNSNSISVLLNTTAPGAGAPGYAPASTFAVGSEPVASAAMDVNGDGHPDLVVTNFTGGTASVLLNTAIPAGTSIAYAAASNFTVGTDPSAITNLDVNADGRLDLAVANNGSNNVSVRLNTTAPGASTPAYATASNFTVGTDPSAITALDVNNDGRPDLAVANRGSNTVSVRLNTTAPGASTPGYAAASTYNVGTNPSAITTLDVNNDGRPDLAVANFNSNTVSVLLNTTAPGASVPGYAAASNFSVGTDPSSIAALDVNNDGLPDLAVANQGSNTVSVLLNTTAPGASVPGYAAAGSFSVGANPSSINSLDVNNDGRQDLAVANFNSNTVSVLLNATAPGASVPGYAAASSFGVGTNPSAITTLDVNNDGRQDLAVANFNSNTVSVLLNATTPGAGTSSFTAASNFSVGTDPSSITAVDVNNDGRPDLAVANNRSNNVSVRLNRAALFDISEGTGTIQDDDTDTTPETFSFTDRSDVGRSMVQTSNSITVAGINTAAPISVTGGQYSIGCTATFTSSTGSINNGQAVCVRHTTSASFGTATNTVLTLGGVSDTFTSTTGAADTTPDAFTFTNRADVAKSTAITSAAVTIRGIEAAAPISVTGGEYSVGCTGNFTSAAGSIGNDQTVCVRHTSSASFSTATDTTLSVGGVSATFTSTTRAADVTPAAFSFADQAGVGQSTAITSAAVTISGIEAPAPISVSGGGYSTGCTGTFTSAAGSIGNGQTVCVRHTSSASFGAATDTVLTVGGVSDTFTSTTRVADTTPDAFQFSDRPGVKPGTTITSDAVAITGIDGAAEISVAGGEYSIGCSGAFTSASATVSNGQTVCVRHTSSASFLAAVDTTLSAGGVSDTFTSTTGAANTVPNAFTFTDQHGAGVELHTLITSAAVTMEGLEAPAATSVTGGEYSVDCTGTFTSADGTIRNGQTVCVRHTSASDFNTATNTVFTAGGVSDTFTSTTRAIGRTPAIGGAMGLADALLGLLAVLGLGRRSRFISRDAGVTREPAGR